MFCVQLTFRFPPLSPTRTTLGCSRARFGRREYLDAAGRIRGCVTDGEINRSDNRGRFAVLHTPQERN